MESHFRSLIKAVTWRTGGTLVTFAIALIIAGNFDIAAKIGILDTFVKIGAYYIHERFWDRLNFGKRKPPEYNI